ncbi:rCG20466, partial [Rattus norvegicus]
MRLPCFPRVLMSRETPDPYRTGLERVGDWMLPSLNTEELQSFQGHPLAPALPAGTPKRPAPSAPTPCTQSVFSQVFGGSHRHSLGCNRNLSRLQYFPTSMIFFFCCCSIFDSRIIPAPVLSVEIKHPSCS